MSQATFVSVIILGLFILVLHWECIPEGKKVTFTACLQVHLSVPNVDQFINLLLSIPAQGYDNSLVYIMSVWSQLQGKCSHAV
jgi:hypothetical protein